MNDWPEIGTSAAAVRSCVSLMAAVCAQPEAAIERWLDLYYQVRLAYEKDKAAARAAEMCGISPGKDRFVEAAMKTAAERITKRLREELKIPQDGPMRAASQECRTLPARQDAPTEKDETAADPETKPEPLRENRVKRQGGKGKPKNIGNTSSRDAAVFKRQVRDRLEAARARGVSSPELVKAADDGGFEDDDIYKILNGRVLGIDIYRALDKALRKLEGPAASGEERIATPV